MEELGLIERVIDKATGTVDYMRTPRAVELHPILVALGNWAQRNLDVQDALCDLDAGSLMWLLRRKINTDELPPTRVVMRFHFADAPTPERSCWMIAKPGVAVDLCLSDPGFDVDLYVDTQVPVLTGVLFGRYSLSREIEQERIRLIGSPRISRTIGKWLRLSTFAPSAVLAQMDGPAVMTGFVEDNATLK
jgi:hypothetical protein